MQSSNLLYSIGEMAKLCGVSIKALRYYDEKGILTPAYIDPITNYRYYKKQQVLNVMIIKEYKSLNFSLTEIKTANKGEITELLGCLNNKLLETNKKIKELKYIKERISEYINEFSKENILMCDTESNHQVNNFSLQFIDEYDVVFTRYKCVHNPNMMLERYRQLNEIMEINNLYKIGPLMAIFHDNYLNYDYSNADIEVCCSVVGDNKNLSCVRKLGGFWALKGLHHGPYSTLVDTYRKSLTWFKINNLEYLGHSAIERYIVDAVSTLDSNKYVTEIILPVKM